MNGNRHLARPLVFLITTSTVTLGGMVLDYFLLQNGVRPVHVLLMSNVFLAAATATSLLLNNMRQLEKQQTLTDRLETVSEMNIHVHNALTAIAFYGRQTDNDHGMQVVSESLGRIEKSLQHVVFRWRLIPERRVGFKVPQGGVLRNVLRFRSP